MWQRRRNGLCHRNNIFNAGMERGAHPALTRDSGSAVGCEHSRLGRGPMAQIGGCCGLGFQPGVKPPGCCPLCQGLLTVQKPAGRGLVGGDPGVRLHPGRAHSRKEERETDLRPTPPQHPGSSRILTGGGGGCHRAWTKVNPLCSCLQVWALDPRGA